MPDLPDYPRSRAVLIGTAAYRDSRFPPVPAAANSLNGMCQILTNPGLCGWPRDRVTVIEDPTDMRRLVQTLRWLARETDDVLLVYFAGHGVTVSRGELCLILTDTDAGDPDITGLPYHHVREALLDSRARLKVSVLDCCFSGRAIEALSGGIHIASSTDVRGVYTVTASDQTAHVAPLAEQASTTTSFTGELLDLISTGIPDGPEWLTLDLLYRHLRDRLRRRGLPDPNQRNVDTAAQFSFTRNAAHRSHASPGTDADGGAGAAVQATPPLPATSATVSFSKGRQSLDDRAPQRPRHQRARPADGISGGVQRRTILRAGLGVAAAAGISGGGILLESALSSGAHPRSSPAPGAGHPRGSASVTTGIPTALTQIQEATLTGHTGSIDSLRFSPDGKLLASGSDDHTVRLWDVAAHTGVVTLHGHTRTVESVAFSPDGKLLASGSDDHTVRLWDVAAHTGVATLHGHTRIVESVAFSPDGKLLASGSDDHTVRLWDVASHTGIATLHGHTGTVYSVAFSPNGQILASGSSDRTIRWWDVANRTSVAIPTGQIYSVAFSPDGQTLASGSGANTAGLWDTHSHINLATLTGISTVYSVAFSPDGKLLAGASEPVQLWGVTSHSRITALGDQSYAVAFGQDGLLACGISSTDYGIQLWQIG